MKKALIGRIHSIIHKYETEVLYKAYCTFLHCPMLLKLTLPATDTILHRQQWHCPVLRTIKQN